MDTVNIKHPTIAIGIFVGILPIMFSVWFGGTIIMFPERFKEVDDYTHSFKPNNISSADSLNSPGFSLFPYFFICATTIASGIIWIYGVIKRKLTFIMSAFGWWTVLMSAWYSFMIYKFLESLFTFNWCINISAPTTLVTLLLTALYSIGVHSYIKIKKFLQTEGMQNHPNGGRYRPPSENNRSVA